MASSPGPRLIADRSPASSWRCRESNPGPSLFCQGFSERSSLCLYSAPPITRASRCDGPSRWLISPHEPRDRVRLASLLADAGELGRRRPQADRLATYLRRQERSQRGSYPWRLLFSDDRFSRRRRLPRLASPVSTYEVETSHPPVMGQHSTLAHSMPLLRRPSARFISRCASRAAMSCRLSYAFLPLASPSSTLAQPSLK